MNAFFYSHYCLVLDVLSILILRWKIFSVDFGLIVKIANDLNCIGDIKHFNIVFVCGDNNSYISFGCFDEIILFESE